jgi:hypothetical protein
MQATAMGESLYLALFIWAVAFFAEFAHGKTKALTKCGLCLAAACLTRYDGWFLTGALVIAATVVVFNSGRSRLDEAPKSLRIALVKFALIAAVAPALWLGYNAAVYRNPLEFANGRYSAKAIEQKTATVNPVKGDLRAAASYFLKAAQLNVAERQWQGRLWLALAVIGSLVAASRRAGRVLLLLWTPLPFYALSMAYGSVPIFVPTWWPFSNYNVRYGLQLLPAFAVFGPLGISFIVYSAAAMLPLEASWRRWSGAGTFVGVVLLGVASYGAIWRADPICYREAAINSRGRVALDAQLARWIESFPPNSALLMFLGEHAGALEQSGIPLRRTINEGNHRVWKQPSDEEGLWERALANPTEYADYMIACAGDPVWQSARDRHLTALVEIHAMGQPPAAIFQLRK